MTRAGGHSDSNLLRRCQAGDEDAFRAVYRQHQGPVYRFALHMAGDPAIAEDVAQEVFMTLIEKRSGFDGSRGTLRSYLIGMARHFLLHRYERDRKYVALAEPDTHDENGGAAPNSNGAHVAASVPPIDISRTQSIERVRQAVLSLPAEYRETVVLCELQEFSYEEAASVLDCPVGTVRSRLHRARTMLAEKLRELAEPVRRASAASRMGGAA